MPAHNAETRRRVYPVADATKVVKTIEKIDSTGRTTRHFISLPRIGTIHGKVETNAAVSIPQG